MAQLIRNSLNKFNDLLFSKVTSSSYLSQLLEKAVEITGIPGQFLVTGFTSLLLLIFVLSFGSYVALDLIVVLYPSYMSFHALEDDDWYKCKKWTQYWIVFGMINTIGRIGDSLLFWLPGYYFLKFLFFLWCFAPVDLNGSTILYENYIRPAFMFNTEAAEAVIEKVRRLSTYPGTDQKYESYIEKK